MGLAPNSAMHFLAVSTVIGDFKNGAHLSWLFDDFVIRHYERIAKREEAKKPESENPGLYIPTHGYVTNVLLPWNPSWSEYTWSSDSISNAWFLIPLIKILGKTFCYTNPSPWFFYQCQILPIVIPSSLSYKDKSCWKKSELDHETIIIYPHDTYIKDSFILKESSYYHACS